MDIDGRSMLRAGPAFAAMLVVAAAVGRPFGHMPSPEAVERRFEQHRLRVLFGTWLESLAACLLAIFATGLHARVRAASSDAAPLASLALAGGTVTAGVLLGRAAVVAAAAERAGGEGATRETATLAVDVGNLLVGKMAPVGLALMTGATTMATRHSQLLPPWMARSGAALTAGLLSPVNFLFIVPSLVWVATVGWVLQKRWIPAGVGAVVDGVDGGRR
jgi:hypothetical protein